MASIIRSRLRSLYLFHRHFSASSIPTPENPSSILATPIPTPDNPSSENENPSSILATPIPTPDNPSSENENPSSILATPIPTPDNPSSKKENPSSILARKQKSRATLALLKSESDPNRIIDIARAASLNPMSPIDRDSLSIVISKLSESQSSALPSFLDEFTSRPDLQSEPSLSHLIILYGRAGMLDQAIHTFQHLDELSVPERTTRSLNAVLSACLFNNNHDKLIQIFHEFPKIYNISPDINTYNTVIESFRFSGKSTSAYTILDEMRREGIKTNANMYKTLLSGLYAEEKYDDVEKVLEMMEKDDCFTGTSPHDVRIQCLCRAKKAREAKALFDEFIASGVQLNSATYTLLIYRFCRDGDLEEAKRLFDEMGEKGCVPSGSSYFTLIDFLCQDGQFDTALRLSKECMAKDWMPSFSTMKLLVDGLVKDLKMEEAQKIVGKLKERFPNASHMWTEVEEGWPQQ